MPRIKSNQYKAQPGEKSNRNTGISKYLSIITLNVNRFNSPRKNMNYLT
jgi:hypothetical protein